MKQRDHLPFHPRTGLRAVGIVNGRPVWPILGGAPVDETTTLASLSGLTADETRAELAKITARLHELHYDDHGDMRELEGDERGEFDRLVHLRDRGETQIRALDQVGRGVGMEIAFMGSGDDRAGSPGEQLRSQAMRTVDAAVRAKRLPEYAAERVENLLRSGNPAESSLTARYAAAAGAPAYERAFAAWVADPIRGHMTWSGEEQAAYRAVHELRTAMSTGSTAGGEMIPLTLDPAIMLTNAGSNNPLRQVSRIVQTITNTWQGVSSAGATAEWKAEGVQAADGGPAVAAKPIPVYTADVDVPFSYEVEMDAVSFMAELSRVMNDAVIQLTNTGYTTGGGSTLPKGYVPNATAPTRTAGAFTQADVYLLQNSLPPRFSAGALWLANIAVINAISAFETTAGNLKFPEIRDAPPRLLTKPLYENSNQSGDMTTAASRFLAYGDFQQFVIVDRLGSTLEILPGYGANQRPSGQRHAFLYFRTGSDLVIPTAVQVIAKS